MKELSHSILCLLADNDCVILPGIGGFISHYESAKYNSDSKTFISPKKVVGFNSAITLNDGLLVQAYMQIFDLGYPDASRLLDKDLKKLIDTLNEQGSFNIEGLGMLKRHNEDAVQFEASSLELVAPGFYALPDVSVAQTAQAKDEEKPAAAGEQPSAPIVIASLAPAVTPADTGESEETSEVYTLSMRRSIAHAVCAAAAVIIAFCFISVPLSNPLNKNMEAAVGYDIFRDAPQASKAAQAKPVAPKAEAGAPAAAAPCNDAQTSAAEAQTAKTEAPAPAPKAEEKAAPAEVAPAKPYTIVLASSVSEKNAEIFVNKLKGRGFDKAEVYSGKSMRRVIYSHYSNEEEARAALNKLNEQDFAADAWVLKLK